jgi:hypothetical protein
MNSKVTNAHLVFDSATTAARDGQEASRRDSLVDVRDWKGVMDRP